jgi:hypothetical protein
MAARLGHPEARGDDGIGGACRHPGHPTRWQLHPGAGPGAGRRDGAAQLLPTGSGRLSGCHGSDLTDAVLEPGKAVWLPLGDFGLLGVPFVVKP